MLTFCYWSSREIVKLLSSSGSRIVTAECPPLRRKDTTWQTHKLLSNYPVLRLGSTLESGPTVIQHLQLMLNERGGFPVVTVDGVFGPTTDRSVKHYQQNENVTVDGVVGRQTWTSLLSKWLLHRKQGRCYWNGCRRPPTFAAGLGWPQR